MLTCVDLFTGIGGIQHALRGAVRPLLYCDIDPKVQRILHHNMQRGLLPVAPIVSDVSDVPAIVKTVAGRHVDLLIATPSCKGFSNANHHSRHGLLHAETSLFSKVFDIAKRLRPDAILLENVPGILKTNGGKDLDTIVSSLHALGYHGRFGVFSAQEVGAPHSRRRWYALCYRDDATLDRLRLAKDMVRPLTNTWKNDPPKPHLLSIPEDRELYSDIKTRIGVLGNAVVPACAQHAFSCLVSMSCDPGKSREFTFVLDPKAAPSRRRPGCRTFSIRSPVTKHLFPTPRYGIRWSCNALTHRCMGDLPAFVRFWKDAQGDRHGVLNPVFVEWIMGFPRNWTEATL